MTIQFSETALKILKKLDKSIQKQIVNYAKELSTLEDPRCRGKTLKSNLAGLWRYRVADYRLICEIHDDILSITIVKIGHRRDVYSD